LLKWYVGCCVRVNNKDVPDDCADYIDCDDCDCYDYNTVSSNSNNFDYIPKQLTNTSNNSLSLIAIISHPLIYLSYYALHPPLQI